MPDMRDDADAEAALEKGSAKLLASVDKRADS